MIKSVFLIGLLIYLFPAYSQAIKVQRLDSARWRMEQVQAQSKAGGATVVYSDIADSATTITKYIQLVEAAKQAVEMKVAEKQYNDLNDELHRITGKRYEDILRSAVQESIIGTWEIYRATDTLTVNINRAMKVSGGLIRGEIKYNSPTDIQLIGVFKEPQKMALQSRGFMKGEGIEARKQE